MLIVSGALRNIFISFIFYFYAPWDSTVFTQLLLHPKLKRDVQLQTNYLTTGAENLDQ